MQSGEIKQDYTVPIKVNLVIVKVNKGEKPLIGILKDDYGKYYIPELPLLKNKECVDVAISIAHRYIRLDATRDYIIELCSMHDKRNRYVGQGNHDIAIVYRAFIPKDFEFDESLIWIDAIELIGLDESESFDKDYANIIKKAMSNDGFG